MLRDDLIALLQKHRNNDVSIILTADNAEIHDGTVYNVRYNPLADTIEILADAYGELRGPDDKSAVDKCRACGKPNDDGEGYAGYCGNCADKLQRLEDAGEDIDWDEGDWTLDDLDRAVDALEVLGEVADA